MALIAAVSLLVTLAADAAALRVLARPPVPRPADPTLPPISVLKPLKGLDEELIENLASLAVQDYPRFQLVLRTEDPGDPALAGAERLREGLPPGGVTGVAGAP